MSDEFVVDASDTQFIVSAGNGLAENVLVLNQGVVPPQSSPNDEYSKIIEEYKLSDLIGEIARYRIWRLRKNGEWAKITDDSGAIQFYSWEDFVTHIIEILHCSRQQLFDRLRVYEQLNWLGYDSEQSIMMITDQPSLYTRVLGKIIDWDQRKEQPRSIALPGITNNTTKEKAIESVRNILEEVTTFDSQKDALQYISETVLLEPQIKVFYDGDIITVQFYQQSVEPDGSLKVEDYGEVKFYPSDELPEWARNELGKVIKYNANTPK